MEKMVFSLIRKVEMVESMAKSNIIMVTQVKTSQTLYAKTRLVFFLSKLFALNQFSLPEPQYSVLNALYTSAVLLTILGNIMYIFYDGVDLNSTQETVDTKSKLPVITIYVRMMFLIMCNILFYVSCVIKHKNISSIFTRVNNIDCNIQMLQQPEEKHQVSSLKQIRDLLFTGLILGCHLTGQILRYMVSYYSFYFISIYTVASITSILLELQFVAILTNIHRSLAALSDQMRRNKHTVTVSKMLDKKVSFYDFKQDRLLRNYPFIKAILRLHYYLCDVCSAVNEVYGIKILLIIGYDFVVITSILFKLTSNLLANNSTSSTHTSYAYSLTHIYLCLLKCFMLYLIVRTADRVTKEASKLLKISHKLQLKNELAILSLDLQCFIQRLDRHKISFCAYGFFPLDYTLLYTIVGAATTYWVILVQFQLSYNI